MVVGDGCGAVIVKGVESCGAPMPRSDDRQKPLHGACAESEEGERAHCQKESFSMLQDSRTR